MSLSNNVVVVWDSKPANGKPINWVELKTSADIRNDRDMITLERKLMKFWIQSFLLGVPKIIIGFRTPDGILKRVEEMDTASIPGTVKRRGKGTWDGNMCINFAAALLDCESCSTSLVLLLTGDSYKSFYYWGWCLADTKAGKIIHDRYLQGRGDRSW